MNIIKHLLKSIKCRHHYTIVDQYIIDFGRTKHCDVVCEKCGDSYVYDIFDWKGYRTARENTEAKYNMDFQDYLNLIYRRKMQEEQS